MLNRQNRDLAGHLVDRIIDNVAVLARDMLAHAFDVLILAESWKCRQQRDGIQDGVADAQGGIGIFNPSLEN